MDMMLQLMARQMGININLGDANNGNNNNRGNDNGGRDNINGNNNNGNEADNFRHVARLARTSSSRPLLPTFPPRDPVQLINEPQIAEF